MCVNNLIKLFTCSIPRLSHCTEAAQLCLTLLYMFLISCVKGSHLIDWWLSCACVRMWLWRQFISFGVLYFFLYEITGAFLCNFAKKSSYKKQKDEMTGYFVCYFAEKSSYKKQKDEKTKALAKRCCFVLIFQCLHIYQNFRKTPTTSTSECFHVFSCSNLRWGEC